MLALIQGRKPDLVPFVQYDGLAAPNEEVWSVVGRENMGVLRWTQVHRLEHPNCSVDSEEFERDGRRGVRTRLSTPAGELTEERIVEPGYGSSAIRKHFVTDPEDYPIFAAFLRDTQVVADAEAYRRSVRELGDHGLPLVRVERTPFQQMWVQWVCLEDLCVHLAEFADPVEECLGLLADIERQIMGVIADQADDLDLPMVDFPDNITAPVIGRKLFQQYCMPFYRELSDMLAEENVPVFVHMDGDLKPLWDLIGTSGVSGLDSMSPPPDNDTSVADAIRLWPEMRLCVNFPSSVHLAEPEAIYATARRLIDEAGDSGRLQIQISENVPKGAWRTSYPEIVRAIRDACG